MKYRRVFKVLNKEGHVFGLCWATEPEIRKFIDNEYGVPIELADKDWKVKAYHKIFDAVDLRYEKFNDYHVEDGEPATLSIDQKSFNNKDLYEDLSFKRDEFCVIRLIKLYKTNGICPKSGHWFNTINSELNFYQEKDRFGQDFRSREFFYFVRASKA